MLASAGIPALEDESIERLDQILEAGAEALNCQRVLNKTGDSIVSEVLREQDRFVEWQHYPVGDVYDPEYHSQYYYHAHPKDERVDGEHGHFHTFLRPFGMPSGIKPLALPDLTPPANENDALSHLIGVSMDRYGMPFRLFSTNRWVTGETWYGAADVVQMLDHFAIDHARPSWPLNRWLTAILRLFRPQIVTLLHRRDEAIDRFVQDHRTDNVFEDRRLEIASGGTIDIPQQIDAAERARRMKKRRAQSRTG